MVRQILRGVGWGNESTHIDGHDGNGERNDEDCNVEVRPPILYNNSRRSEVIR